MKFVTKRECLLQTRALEALVKDYYVLSINYHALVRNNFNTEEDVRLMAGRGYRYIIPKFIKQLEESIQDFNILLYHRNEQSTGYFKVNEYKPVDLLCGKLSQLYLRTSNNGVRQVDLHILFENEEDYLLAKTTNIFGIG